VALVIGEGGSGGALAIGVADVVCMLSYSVYSVISPEGCASILWKDAAHAETAADALGMTAQRLQGLGLIDVVVPEPTGGAHRDPAKAAEFAGRALRDALKSLRAQSPAERHAKRQQKLRAYGALEQAA
jgi:acetyl-CoA carboxylase carboxyl transferase subunit alpha